MTDGTLLRMAKYYVGLDHQREAFEFLDKELQDTDLLCPEDVKVALKIYQGGAKKHKHQVVIDFLKEKESFRTVAYLSDPQDPESWTYGYGFEYHVERGDRVRQNDTITRKEAEPHLIELVEDIHDHFRSVIPGYDHLPHLAQQALISFGFNVGKYFYQAHGFATITRCLKDRDWDGVPDALRLYVNPGTAVEEGLRNRRELEAQMWRDGFNS